MKGLRGLAVKEVMMLMGMAVAYGVSAEKIMFQHGSKPDASYVQDATSISSQYKSSTGRSSGNLLVGNNAPGSSYRALLGFDLSVIPAGSVIRSASLQLVQMPDFLTSGDKVEVELYSFSDPVSESGSTWTGSEGKYGEKLHTLELKLLERNQSRDVIFSSDALADAVTAALKSGSRIDLAIKLAEENFPGRRMVLFRGNEYEAPQRRPLLSIEFDSPLSVGAADPAGGGLVQIVSSLW